MNDALEILEILGWSCQRHSCDIFTGEVCKFPQRDRCHIALGYRDWVCSCRCHNAVDGMDFYVSDSPSPANYRRMLKYAVAGQ